MLTMRYFTLKTRLLALLLLAATCAVAQPTPAELAARPERSASIYHSYEFLPGPAAPVPAGYKPFYISHYGRHGSRYHSTEAAYAEPLAALRKAAEAGKLTPKGREVLAKVEALAADAEKRYGDLSPRGVQEHRGIAERMYAAYPEVFSTAKGRVCRIESRSTQVPRCILSMAAFNERLKELNPAISATRDASARDMGYLANGPSLKASRKAAGEVADSLTRMRVNPDRLMKSLVTDPSCIDEPLELMKELFMLAAITQDVSHLGIEPFYEIFTEEELYKLWECENARRASAIRSSLTPDRCCATSLRRPTRLSRGNPTFRPRCVSGTIPMWFPCWPCCAPKGPQTGWSRSTTLPRRGMPRR